jgi:MoxR-like ATPase
MAADVAEITKEVEEKSKFIKQLVSEINKVMVGQEYMIERLLIGILANGHILVEGVPGLAKTTAVKTLAQAINTKFQRIQFTPDMLPADLIGTQIYLPKTGDFTTKKGPLFANVILADEINRAPAKVQSALLEAMQERQVTIGEDTFPLEEPFLVMATQNPIEQEGTYPLPEAQIDRFMLKLRIMYPNKKEEKEIMQRMAIPKTISVDPVLGPQEIFEARKAVDHIYIDDKLQDYIVDIVMATRDPRLYGMEIDNMLKYGASPRATICLNQTARAYAFLQGRGYVTPQDIKTVGFDVLRHRLILTYEAEAEELSSDDIIQQIFDHVEVP